MNTLQINTLIELHCVVLLLNSGAVELENLPLRKDALREFDLPFEVKTGEEEHIFKSVFPQNQTSFYSAHWNMKPIFSLMLIPKLNVRIEKLTKVSAQKHMIEFFLKGQFTKTYSCLYPLCYVVCI